VVGAVALSAHPYTGGTTIIDQAESPVAPMGEEEQLPSQTTKFAHPSEQEFARILDFYSVPWQYEPRTFQLRWDEDGNPLESFAPDFYLPEFDLYIELTTLKQSLVTRKNRKLRHLRELYPGIQVKLLYRNDYHKLMLKYRLPHKPSVGHSNH
jgi:hypothetical protein